MSVSQHSQYLSEDDSDSELWPHRSLNTTEREIRPTTPETDITDYPAKPDITMMCNKCKIFIDLRDIKDHRAYHSALETLKYKNDAMPINVEMLVRRRKGLLRKLKSKASPENPMESSEIQRINDAFELLKSELEDTYENCRQVKPDLAIVSDAVALNSSTKCVYALSICEDRNAHWKSSMEDTHVYQDSFGGDEDKSYFAMFDGHNGIHAAQTASEELHYFLLRQMRKFDHKIEFEHMFCMDEMGENLDYSAFDKDQIEDNKVSESNDNKGSAKASKTPKDPYSVKMGEAFKKAYKDMDHFLSLGNDEQSRVRWSGCSACTVIVQNTCEDEKMFEEFDRNSEQHPLKPPQQIGMLHLAHVGNVQAVLVRDNRAYKLTKNHTPSNPKERARILKAGATLNSSHVDQRVNGILATTRGIGNHGDLLLKKSVINDPYTTSVKIDQYAQFLILASHGVWEIFNENEAASLLVQMLPMNEVTDPSQVSTSINLLLAEHNARVQSNAMGEDYDSVVESTNADFKFLSRPTTGEKKLTFDAPSENNVQITKTGPGSEISGRNSAQPLSQKTVSKSQYEKSQRGSAVTHQLSITDDLQTEIGSHYDGMDGGESGHEADVDTNTDLLSIPANSRLSNYVPTREETQRDFAKAMSERLVQAALLAGAKDNISVMVILLPGCGL